MVTLVRGAQVLSGFDADGGARSIEDGAVLVEKGLVKAVGSFADLRAAHADAEILGNGREVVLPGLVNAHHHVGLTPLMLGSPDMPLELWWITRLGLKAVDPYLDTLYSAMEMIGSGVTTVTHIQGWVRGGLERVSASANRVLDAYETIGMRASYCFAVREQERLVYMDDEAFCETLPEGLRGRMGRVYADLRLTLDEHMQLFETLHRTRRSDRIGVQLAPGNLHWCSDAGLQTIADHSRRHDVPMHIHLVETAYQREYAYRRTGRSALAHLDHLGLLNERLTIGHGTWLSEADLDRMAGTGACICHNCSSNFRLRSGIAPVNAMRRRGIPIAIGIDEAGINDDRDMLLEMRMVLRAHRTPGMEDDVPSPAEVLRMATLGGAATTAFRGRIGRLEPGAAADLILIDQDRVRYPYLDPEISWLDALVQKARPEHVRTVMVGGEVLYSQGRFTRVDRDAVLGEIHRDLHRALSPDEEERRALAREVLPLVKAFYDRYVRFEDHQPFDARNCRI